MDPVKIPAEQVIPMEAIAPGVQGLRIAFANVFSVAHQDGSWTLIDAGLPFTALEQNPYAGHVFVFRDRRGDVIKLLWWDGDGLRLFARVWNAAASYGRRPTKSRWH